MKSKMSGSACVCVGGGGRSVTADYQGCIVLPELIDSKVYYPYSYDVLYTF